MKRKSVVSKLLNYAVPLDVPLRMRKRTWRMALKHLGIEAEIFYHKDGLRHNAGNGNGAMINKALEFVAAVNALRNPTRTEVRLLLDRYKQ